MAANPITNASKAEQSLPVRSVPLEELGPRDSGAEPPWPEFPRQQELHWETFMRFSAPMEAHIVAGQLNAEGVPTVVLSAAGLEFVFAVELLVPRALVHRARWVLAWPPLSDEELLFLATGEIGPVDEDPNDKQHNDK